MAAPAAGERSLQETPTWAVALVCAVFVIVSVLIEHGIESLAKVRVLLVISVLKVFEAKRNEQNKIDLLLMISVSLEVLSVIQIKIKILFGF